MARAFLITPFSPESAGHEDPAIFRAVQDAVDLAAARTGLELVHPARINRAGVIMEQVEQEIRRADLVIAVLTGSNPNVYFELGRASCPKILLVDSINHIPFDLRHHRTLTYSTPEEVACLADRLAASIEETLAAAETRFDAAKCEYLNRVPLALDTVRFSGLERSDLFTGGPTLTSIFVPLALEELKLVRRETPPKDSQDNKPTDSSDKKSTGEPPSLVMTSTEPVEIDEALNDNLVILGEPGSGKSALLRWLTIDAARKALNGDQRVPLHIELARLPGEYVSGGVEPSWVAILPGLITGQQAFTSMPQEMLKHTVDSVPCLLLFDGLDEIVSSKARLRIASSLVDFARLFPNHRFVLATRPSAFVETESVLRTRFRICRIRQFSEKDIERCIHLWYSLDRKATPEAQLESARALYRRIQDTPRLIELAASPLLAMILLLIWRNEGDLPERRIDLYERCCRMLIRWDEQREVPEGAVGDAERHMQILRALAYSMHRRGCLMASRSDLKDANGSSADGSRLEGGSGILQRTDGDLYRFPHQTIQEYLAARHIAGLPEEQCIGTVLERLHEPWWEQVHRLTIGHLASDPNTRTKCSKLVARILGRHRPPNPILRFRPLPPPQWNPAKFVSGLQIERRVAWLLRREFELADRKSTRLNSSHSSPSRMPSSA